jgi:hypothetical protein
LHERGLKRPLLSSLTKIETGSWESQGTYSSDFIGKLVTVRAGAEERDNSASVIIVDISVVMKIL